MQNCQKLFSIILTITIFSSITLNTYIYGEPKKIRRSQISTTELAKIEAKNKEIEDAAKRLHNEGINRGYLKDAIILSSGVIALCSPALVAKGYLAVIVLDNMTNITEKLKMMERLNKLFGTKADAVGIGLLAGTTCGIVGSLVCCGIAYLGQGQVEATNQTKLLISVGIGSILASAVAGKLATTKMNQNKEIEYKQKIEELFKDYTIIEEG